MIPVSQAVWYITSAADEDVGLPALARETTSNSTARRPRPWWVAAASAASAASLLLGMPGVTSAGSTSPRTLAVRSTWSSLDEALSPSGAAAMVDSHGPSSEVKAAAGIPGSTVLGVVDDLCQWLGLTKTQIATVGQFDRRSLSNWKRQDAYPSTVRHLMGVHAVVGAIVSKLGREGGIAWLAGRANGMALASVLADEREVVRIAREAAPFLYQTPPRESQYDGLAFDGDGPVIPMGQRAPRPPVSVELPSTRR